jgi:ElaB/YqjD/DUF883 family membrane-anchored ribosome-binding protein
MSSNAEQLLGQLHRIVADLEGLAKAASGAAGEGRSEVADQLKEALNSARTRLRDAEHGLQRDVVRGAKAADTYVHEHTWMSVGIAAAVAFLLGALTARRD